VLLTDFHPNDVVVGHFSPLAGDLGCFAEGDGVEVGEDFVGYFGGESRDVVDADQLVHLGGYKGELRETALGKDSLEDEFAVEGRCC
jgi:hypothetical protein